MRLLAGLLAVAFAAESALAHDEQSGGAAFVTLGTSGGPVSIAARSQPANALFTPDGVWLVDAGDASAQQLPRSACRFLP